MTAYCTQSDLLLEVREEVLVQLTQDDDEVTTLDTTVLNRAIDRASNEIDAHAGAHYAVPFSPIPGYIRDLAVDFTLVSLAMRRETQPDWAEKRNKRVTLALQALAAGTLTTAVQPEPPLNAERVGALQGQDRTFSASSLRGFSW